LCKKKKLLDDVNFHNLSITTEKPGMLNSQIPKRSQAQEKGREFTGDSGVERGEVTSETTLL